MSGADDRELGEPGIGAPFGQAEGIVSGIGDVILLLLRAVVELGIDRGEIVRQLDELIDATIAEPHRATVPIAARAMLLDAPPPLRVIAGGRPAHRARAEPR